MRTFENLFMIQNIEQKNNLIEIVDIGTQFICFIPLLPVGGDILTDKEMILFEFYSSVLKFAFLNQYAFILILDSLLDDDFEIMIFDCIMESFQENLIVIYKN